MGKEQPVDPEGFPIPPDEVKADEPQLPANQHTFVDPSIAEAAEAEAQAATDAAVERGEAESDHTVATPLPTNVTQSDAERAVAEAEVAKTLPFLDGTKKGEFYTSFADEFSLRELDEGHDGPDDANGNAATSVTTYARTTNKLGQEGWAVKPA